MALVNVTGFQRARRLAAEKAARAAKIEQKEVDGTNTPNNQEDAREDQNEPDKEPVNDQEDETFDPKPLSPDDVDGMDREQLEQALNNFYIKFAHNSKDETLKGKLKDAING